MKKDKLRCGWQMQICVKAICVTSSWKNGGWGCPLWPWTATGCRYQGWPFACSLWQKFPDHSRSFSVHGSRCVSGWGLEYFLENSRSRKLGFGRDKLQQMCPRSFNVALLGPKGAIRAAAAHSQRGGDWDCTRSLCSWLRIRFYGERPTSC